MMGFPFDSQWKQAVRGSEGHGLSKNPTSVHMFTDLNVLAARMRALPFHKTSARFRAQVVGGLVWMDFHEGLVTSTPHRFSYHCTLLDDRSRFGRMIPTKEKTAAEAVRCLKMFQADLQELAQEVVPILEVSADNVPF